MDDPNTSDPQALRDAEDSNLIAMAEFGSRELPAMLEQIEHTPLGELHEMIRSSEVAVAVARVRLDEARRVGDVARDHLRGIVAEFEDRQKGKPDSDLAPGELTHTPAAPPEGLDYLSLGAEDWGTPQPGDRPAPVMADQPADSELYPPCIADRPLHRNHPLYPTRAQIASDSAAMTRLAQAGRVAEERSRAAAAVHEGQHGPRCEECMAVRWAQGRG